VFNLPEITANAIDRRMYHIFNESDIQVSPANNNIVEIHPFAGQWMWDSDTDTMIQDGVYKLSPGDAMQINAAFDGYNNGTLGTPVLVPTWRLL
jgi:hypothetical protein